MQFIPIHHMALHLEALIISLYATTQIHLMAAMFLQVIHITFQLLLMDKVYSLMVISTSILLKLKFI
jgi:hypothetical protein